MICVKFGTMNTPFISRTEIYIVETDKTSIVKRARPADSNKLDTAPWKNQMC